MARITVDMDRLLVTAISQALPNVHVASDLDPGTTTYPVIVPTPVTGQMISNGHWQLGWSWTVSFNLAAFGRREASDLADELYQAVHNLEGAHFDGIGGIASVEDSQMPTKSGATQIAGGKTLVQYVAQFTMRVKPPRT